MAALMFLLANWRMSSVGHDPNSPVAPSIIVSMRTGNVSLLNCPVAAASRLERRRASMASTGCLASSVELYTVKPYVYVTWRYVTASMIGVLHAITQVLWWHCINKEHMQGNAENTGKCKNTHGNWK
jgi:hypothetical protein